MHQIRFRLGLDSDPAGGASLQLPQTPYLDLTGLLLREGRDKGRYERGGKGEGRGGEGRGRELRGAEIHDCGMNFNNNITE